MDRPLVIAGRYNGPDGSGNGGYTCGLVAARLGAGPAEVTLRVPPPLDRSLAVERVDGELRVRDGDTLVAEARAAAPEGEVPGAVPYDVAERASARYAGFTSHEFPRCFVCGPLRSAGDGLRVFAGPVQGTELVAAPWTPDEVRPELVWAALDCPGAFAVGFAERGETLLGRMTADVLRVPRTRERCVVIAWPRGEEGRKLYAGTALFGDEGELLAHARQTWIVPR